MTVAPWRELDRVEAMRTGLSMERIRRAGGRAPMPEQALRWTARNGHAALRRWELRMAAGWPRATGRSWS
jgi:hypothetical protein